VDGQMIDLDAWLDAVNPVVGAPWFLLEATGISDTGWITGIGVYQEDLSGETDPLIRAFLLDASSLVPEPASLILCASCSWATSLFALRKPRRGGRVPVAVEGALYDALST
jgi:hypothetical protein